MIAFPIRAMPALALLLVLMLVLATAAMPARAQTGGVVPVEQWNIYGADGRFAADEAVPGRGIVSIAADRPLAEEWSSAAGVALPMALKRGGRISAVFWARADRPATVPVMLLAREAPFAVLSRKQVALTTIWQRVAVTAIAPADLAAGTQGLSVQLGKAGAHVSLGPALWLPGEPAGARIAAAFAAFRPSGVSIDVRVPAAPGVVLAATLRLPQGAGGAKPPVTLLLGGGGPARRGIYSLLAERLLANGIATFEYDKRGLGQSTGEFVDTLPLMQADATAAIAWLRARPDVDGRRVAVLGISQGGVVGPALAARDPGIAAVVMLAAPVGTRSEAFMRGLRDQLAAAGHGAPAIDRIVGAVAPWMAARAANADAEEVARLRAGVLQAFAATGATVEQAAGMVAVLDTPVLLSMYEADPAAQLGRVRAPVLALFAGEDEVISKVDLARAKTVLAGHPDATVIEVPGANHAFQPVGARSKAGEARPAVSMPEVLDLAPAWLARRLRGGQ